MPCLKLSIFKEFFCDPSYGYPLPAYQATIISTKLIPHTCPALWTCVVLMWLYCRPQLSKPKLWINPGPLPIFFSNKTLLEQSHVYLFTYPLAVSRCSSSCCRDCMAYQALIFYYLATYRKKNLSTFLYIIWLLC